MPVGVCCCRLAADPSTEVVCVRDLFFKRIHDNALPVWDGSDGSWAMLVGFRLTVESSFLLPAAEGEAPGNLASAVCSCPSSSPGVEQS